MSSELPTIIVSSDPRLRTASAVIAINVGSKDEFPGTFGLAHVLEHMMFRGTIKYPSQLDFVSQFVKLGAKFNGETSRDRTLYYVTSLPSQILDALTYLIEMIKQPLFDESKLPVEKKAVLNELKTSKAQPGNVLQNQLLLPNVLKDFYPRYHTPMGSLEDVQHVTYQELLELYRCAYTDPTRIVIAIHGNIIERDSDPSAPSDQEMGKFHDRVVDIWNAIPYRFPKVTIQEKEKRANLLTQSLNNLRRQLCNPPYPIVRQGRLSETFVAMGWISAPMESFESYVLSWISAYLTGDLVASLYFQLRVKRGLVYQITSGQYGLQETGVFYVRFQTRRNQNIQLAIRLVLEQIKSLETFSDKKALETWKHWMDTRLDMERDQSIHAAKMYAQQMLVRNRIRSIQEILALVKSLSCKDIRNVARTVFNREMTLAMLT